MVKAGLITGREDTTNRDGEKTVRMLQTEVSSEGDVQSVELADNFGTESNPPVGSRVLLVQVGNAWKLTSAVTDDTDLELAGQVGAKQVYSTDEDGAARVATITLGNGGTITLTNGAASIIMQADGNIEINGNTDTAVAFTDMKAAFDTLTADLNALITAYNSHTHPTAPVGPVSTPSAPGTPSSADMSGAEVPTVKVP